MEKGNGTGVLRVANPETTLQCVTRHGCSRGPYVSCPNVERSVRVFTTGLPNCNLPLGEEVVAFEEGGAVEEIELRASGITRVRCGEPLSR